MFNNLAKQYSTNMASVTQVLFCKRLIYRKKFDYNTHSCIMRRLTLGPDLKGKLKFTTSHV